MKTVFFDIDTQLDFLLPVGALSVPGAERLIPSIARLNRWAAANGVPVISTADAHLEDDPEFRVWPAHCVAGTLGQRKPEATLLEKRVTIPLAQCEVDMAGAQQIILEKRALDCFTNPNLVPLLDAIEAERCVVYGVVTEYCVLLAAQGLQRSGRQVEVVTDAIETLQQDASNAALKSFTAGGGRLTTLAKVIA
jgi:nicotinamidase/pyrazinamidase